MAKGKLAQSPNGLLGVLFIGDDKDTSAGMVARLQFCLP
jgi:hypothetical protein